MTPIAKNIQLAKCFQAFCSSTTVGALEKSMTTQFDCPQKYFRNSVELVHNNYFGSVTEDVLSEFMAIPAIDSITSFAQAEKKLEGLIAKIAKPGDKHSCLRDPRQLRKEVETIQDPSAVSLSNESNNHHLVVKIENFLSQNTAADFEAIVASNREFIEAHKLVLDLRGNCGGYIDQVCQILSSFANKPVEFGNILAYVDDRLEIVKVSVTTKHVKLCAPMGAPSSKTSIQFLRKTEIESLNCPVEVWVDSQTRSAAEMLVTALKPLPNVKVIGTRTYGKGYMQQTLALGRGRALRLTSGIYRTPTNGELRDRGVSPHERRNWS
jgi:hypothetical protein